MNYSIIKIQLSHFSSIRFYEMKKLIKDHKSCVLSIVCLLFVHTIFAQENQSTTVKKEPDSVSIAAIRPDADRDDIPFIDYLPGLITGSEGDTVSDNLYIRKNFTDQLISVWSHPRRYYPASRVYSVSVGENYYRTAKISEDNYVFLQEMVKGKMNLYLYRKIPQTNGWVELVSSDPRNPEYKNNMIVEVRGNRGKRQTFGFYISLEKDSAKLISIKDTELEAFANNYLSGTPLAYAEAMKFSNQKVNKTRKQMLLGLMAVSMLGTMFISSDARWVFLAGFPLAIGVAAINHPNFLGWEDMVRIVKTYNAEVESQ